MENDDRILNALRRVDIFNSASSDDIHKISELGILRLVEESGYFFIQGEKAEYLYILVSGRVKLCTISADGQQVNLRTILPNQLFGALGVVHPGANYPACAQCLEKSSAVAIENTAFAQLIKERPQLAFGMMRLMTSYIQEMQDRYRELATERVEQRIARALLRLAAQSGQKMDQGGIDLVFSRQDVAEMTGTTLFTVSRFISKWEKLGLLSTGRERLRILNPHGLVRIADDLN